MAMAEENEEFAFLSAVQGFHMYRRVWVPRVGQRLRGEHGNTDDHDGPCVLPSPWQTSRLTPSSSSWSSITLSFIRSNTVKHSTWINNLLSI